MASPTPRTPSVIDFRAAGVSGPKIRYLQDLAAHVIDGRLDFDGFHALSDAEVEERLTAVCRWISEELGSGICQIYLRDPHGELLLLQASSARRDPLSQLRHPPLAELEVVC